jgi:flagellar hook-length control protein FliK
VKIVTSSSTTAQRISSEIDSMRQNFDAAGLKLGHSEVSYESESGGGRGEYQPDHQENPSSKEIFTLNEVVE